MKNGHLFICTKSALFALNVRVFDNKVIKAVVYKLGGPAKKSKSRNILQNENCKDDGGVNAVAGWSVEHDYSEIQDTKIPKIAATILL